MTWKKEAWWSLGWLIASVIAATFIMVKQPEFIPSFVLTFSMAGLVMFLSEMRRKMLADEARTAFMDHRTMINGCLDTVKKCDSDAQEMQKEFARISNLLDDDELSKLEDRLGALEIGAGFGQYNEGSKRGRERSS